MKEGENEHRRATSKDYPAIQRKLRGSVCGTTSSFVEFVVKLQNSKFKNP